MSETSETQPTSVAESPPTTAPETTDQTLLNQKTEAPPEGAPETYADFTAPEGFDLNEEVMAKATPLFKELGLTQDSAQKLVNFYADQAKQAAQAPIDFFEQKKSEWRNEIKTDPEIGGKLNQVIPSISRMIDGIGDAKLSADFREAMDFTGAGDNPAFVRALWKISQKLSEGTPVRSGGPVGQDGRPPGQRPTAAQALYPGGPRKSPVGPIEG